MWLIGSTPSKPAALTAWNFSSTLPWMPMVAYMIALRSARFFAGISAAVNLAGASYILSLLKQLQEHDVDPPPRFRDLDVSLLQV